MKSDTIAAIDLGTNSFHLIVVRADSHGGYEVIAKEKEAVRLGSGARDLDHISEEAIERGVAVLKNFVALARAHKASIRAVATSATREARNQKDFLEAVRRECGFEIEVIPGREEARLIYLGAMQAVPTKGKQVLVVDIGGGSTEFVVGTEGKPGYAVSRKLGAIRLKDRFFDKEPLDSNQVDECRQFIRVALAGTQEVIRDMGFDFAIGCSGTIETIATMIAADNSASSLKELEIRPENLGRIVKKITSIKTSKERAGLDGLDEKRADIIVSGAILLQEVFRAMQIERMVISPFALREGVIMDTLMRARKGKARDAGSVADIRRDSVKRVADRYLAHNGRELDSAYHISHLSLRLLDELTRHGLARGITSNDMMLLETAALLHNVGTIIAHSGHHKHSYYIIKNTDYLLGFSPAELEVIAQVARYHRKALPARKHTYFDALPRPLQNQVRMLAGILRIAVNLDRSSRSAVSDLKLETDQSKREFTIVLQPAKKDLDVSVDLWAAENQVELLQEALSRTISFQLAK